MNVSLLNHEWLVIGLALAILLVDLWVPPRSRRNLGYVAVAGLAVVLIYSFAAYGLSPEQTQFAFGDMYAMDRLALFFKRFFLLATLIVLVISVEFAEVLETGAG